MDSDGYPTEEELTKIREWPTDDIKGLFDFIEDECWWTPEFGFKRNGEIIELHTGGWSGNEEIIDSIQHNKNLIWMFTWEESRRGGHYKFKNKEFNLEN